MSKKGGYIPGRDAKSMPIRFIGVALLVTLTLLCSGCYGAKETDAVAYVLLIGVDKAADGKQKVTYQVAVPPRTR